jgi:hypothetical protein
MSRSAEGSVAIRTALVSVVVRSRRRIPAWRPLVLFRRWARDRLGGWNLAASAELMTNLIWSLLRSSEAGMSKPSNPGLRVVRTGDTARIYNSSGQLTVTVVKRGNRANSYDARGRLVRRAVFSANERRYTTCEVGLFLGHPISALDKVYQQISRPSITESTRLPIAFTERVPVLASLRTTKIRWPD